jgi:hypothetical protein
LGTWTLVSISNWTDLPTVARVPPLALRPVSGWDDCDQDNETFLDETAKASCHGYHVFAFWSSKYSWIAHSKEDGNDDPEHTVCKRLRPHETELFHIKKVTPDLPQYIGK